MTDVPSTRSDTVRTVEPLTLCDADDTLVPSESPAYDASVDVVRSRTRSPEGLGRPGRVPTVGTARSLPPAERPQWRAQLVAAGALPVVGSRPELTDLVVPLVGADRRPDLPLR